MRPLLLGGSPLGTNGESIHITHSRYFYTSMGACRIVPSSSLSNAPSPPCHLFLLLLLQRRLLLLLVRGLPSAPATRGEISAGSLGWECPLLQGRARSARELVRIPSVCRFTGTSKQQRVVPQHGQQRCPSTRRPVVLFCSATPEGRRLTGLPRACAAGSELELEFNDRASL
jgi:hypothetical protein